VAAPPMLRFVSSPAHSATLAAWWGFAEADRVLLGVVVAVLAVLAVAYVLMRAHESRKRRTAAVRHR
jgi:hypothetical protein